MDGGECYSQVKIFDFQSLFYDNFYRHLGTEGIEFLRGDLKSRLF